MSIVPGIGCSLQPMKHFEAGFANGKPANCRTLQVRHKLSGKLLVSPTPSSTTHDSYRPKFDHLATRVDSPITAHLSTRVQATSYWCSLYYCILFYKCRQLLTGAQTIIVYSTSVQATSYWCSHYHCILLYKCRQRLTGAHTINAYYSTSAGIFLLALTLSLHIIVQGGIW